MNCRIIILVLILTKALYSQNSGWVKNGFASNISSCPTNFGQTYLADGFDQPNDADADLYARCVNYGMTIPYSYLGYQNIKYANANFFGLIATYRYSLNWSNSQNVREYVRGHFINKLPINKEYCFSFGVNRPNCVFMTLKNFGLLITDSITQNTHYNTVYKLPLSPNYQFPYYILDTLNWQNISYKFIATGQERGFIVGNFNDQQNSDTLVLANYPCTADQSFSDASYIYLTGFSLFEMTAKLGNDTTICQGEQLYIKDTDPKGPNEIWWYKDGVLLDSLKPYFLDIPKVSGDYVMQKRFACGTMSDTMHVTVKDCHEHEIIFDLPNVFTPNGDGVNDEFYIKNNALLNLKEFEVSIYNRWGNKVYQSSNPDFKWKGDNVVNGVYYYIMTAKSENGKEYRQSSYLEVVR